MARFAAPFAALILAAACAGCSTSRALSPADPQAVTASRIASDHGHPVSGYTTTDGVHHAFEGTARLAGDSLFFEAPAREGRGLERPKPARSEHVALADVTSVDALHPDVGASVGLGLLLVALTGGILIAGWAASFDESMM